MEYKLFGGLCRCLVSRFLFLICLFACGWGYWGCFVMVLYDLTLKV